MKKNQSSRPDFSKAVDLPYEFTLAIGDWSKDGHEKSCDITFLSSHPAGVLRDAYLSSVKKTGLTFDRDHKGIEIAVEYGDRRLSDEAKTRLQDIGFDLGSLDSDFLAPRDLANLICWFISQSLPDFRYEPKKTTYLNGYWDKKLNVQFGYGLFD